MRTCGSDGEWSGSPAPECQSKELLNVYVECVPVPIVICSDLPSLADGTINYGGAGSTNSKPVDTVATYTCNTGYTLNGGTTTRTCGSGVWSGSAPTCQRKWNGLCTVCLLSGIVSHTADCPELPPLTNGMIMYSAGSHNNRPFFSHAVHSCNTGYTLTGGTLTAGTTRVCVSGGSWDGSPPTCQGELCNSYTFCVCEYTRVNPIMKVV